MTAKNIKRLAHLAGEYAQAYICQTDAPEGKQGAYELYELVMLLNQQEMRIPNFSGDGGETLTP